MTFWTSIRLCRERIFSLVRHDNNGALKLGAAIQRRCKEPIFELVVGEGREEEEEQVNEQYDEGGQPRAHHLCEHATSQCHLCNLTACSHHVEHSNVGFRSKR